MRATIAITVTTLMLAVGSSFASETNVSKEDREKMAEMHTKMAQCLKSDRAMSDCQSEMMKSCNGMMGKEGCPMMGQMRGMMKGGMMKRGEGEKPASKE